MDESTDAFMTMLRQRVCQWSAGSHRWVNVESVQNPPCLQNNAGTDKEGRRPSCGTISASTSSDNVRARPPISAASSTDSLPSSSANSSSRDGLPRL